jgi:hypothetical protein
VLFFKELSSGLGLVMKSHFDENKYAKHFYEMLCIFISLNYFLKAKFQIIIIIGRFLDMVQIGSKKI